MQLSFAFQALAYIDADSLQPTTT